MTTPNTWDTNIFIFALGVEEGKTGTLTVSNGAKVTGDVIHVAYSGYPRVGGNGSVWVSGAGSRIDINGMYVGNSGSGTLTIENGGVRHPTVRTLAQTLVRPALQLSVE